MTRNPRHPVNRSAPTQAQTRILELLSAFEYLTTGDICEYIAATTTKRAVERKLKRMELLGLIQCEPLNPQRGGASPRAWYLLKKGADLLGIPHEGRQVITEQTVTPRQADVLKLLAEMKQLTTAQIKRHLHRDRPKSYTWQLLNLLKQRGYIRSQRLYPERGAASECYWTIRRRGALAIGHCYDRHYLRRPARHIIEHRGLLLEMARQVEEAGWLLHRPPPLQGRPMQLTTEETPQRQQVVDAVLRKEERALENLVRQGYPVNRLADRIDRLKARQVGAIVPRIVNDYVAYQPDNPEHTVLLIPHPPWAGPGFWNRRPGVRPRIAGTSEKHTSRISRYSRLAKLVPVIAVFNSERAGRHYADLLATGGFHWATVDQVGNRLRRITNTLSKASSGGGQDELNHD